jgi:Family of unknown function (DUF6011)
MKAKRSGRPCQESAAQVVTTTDADSTARPRPVSLLGPRLLHDLSRNGYRVTTTCVACGAPLVDARSVARQLGPVCASRSVTR